MRRSKLFRKQKTSALTQAAERLHLTYQLHLPLQLQYFTCLFTPEIPGTPEKKLTIHGVKKMSNLKKIKHNQRMKILTVLLKILKNFIPEYKNRQKLLILKFYKPKITIFNI